MVRLPWITPEIWQLRADPPPVSIVPTFAVPVGQSAAGVPGVGVGVGVGPGVGVGAGPGITTRLPSPGDATSSAPHAVTASAAALAKSTVRSCLVIMELVSER